MNPDTVHTRISEYEIIEFEVQRDIIDLLITAADSANMSLECFIIASALLVAEDILELGDV